MSEKLIVGLVGEKGSGKETLGDLIIAALSQRRVIKVRYSDILAETLVQWNLPLNRENLQNMAIVMNKGFGDGTLSRAMHHRIAMLEGDIIMLDGVRWESDAALLREFPRNYLIYITAPAEIRYERLKKRNQKVGEGEATFEQFMKEENVLTEQSIPKIGTTADYTIDNSESREMLQKKVDEMIANLL